MTHVIKQFKELQINFCVKSITYGLISYSNLALAELVSQYFYQGKNLGTVSTLKLRTQQLVSKKNITNSYMLGVIYGLVEFLGLDNFRKYNRYYQLHRMVDSKNTSTIDQTLFTYQHATDTPQNFNDLANSYEFLHKLDQIALIIGNQKSANYFALKKLDYHRPISQLEFKKGLKATFKNHEHYLNTLKVSLNQSKKTQDPLQLILLNTITNSLQSEYYAETIIKVINQSTKDYFIMKNLLKL